MKRKVVLNNQHGFTLIEIISVLVILGILAAVAVPKYIDLQEEAANKAAAAAVAEGIAQVNMYSAKYMLRNNGALPTTLSDLTNLPNGLIAPYNATDFTVNFSDNGDQTISIGALGAVGTTVDGGAASGTAYLPTE